MDTLRLSTFLCPFPRSTESLTEPSYSGSLSLPNLGGKEKLDWLSDAYSNLSYLIL